MINSLLSFLVEGSKSNFKEENGSQRYKQTDMPTKDVKQAANPGPRKGHEVYMRKLHGIKCREWLAGGSNET